MIPADLQNLRIDPVPLVRGLQADVLRLDLVHPVISGNKWFKLEGYLKEARQEGRDHLLTFGGAFSNHIVATAAAGAQQGFSTTGLIRGERPRELSPSLQEAIQYGMELHFLTKADYRIKKLPSGLDRENMYIIPEGGYGPKGTEGFAPLLSHPGFEQYTHIAAAAGTGTTLAGITKNLREHQQAIGISVFRNNFSLESEIRALLDAREHNRFKLIHDYGFGGYAKPTPELIGFMNEWYSNTGIPSDFVYTAKLFFAIHVLAQSNFFPATSKILIIHSGGLQGNRSLPKGTLIF